MAKRKAYAQLWPPTSWGRREIAIAGALAAFVLVLIIWAVFSGNGAPTEAKPVRVPGVFEPTPAQWATLTVEPVRSRVFRALHVTEGKITVNE